MSTPITFSVPPISAEQLATRLESELRRGQRTPLAQFQQPCVQHAFDYICEVEHSKRSVHEVDKVREAIATPRYWEFEARHLHDELFKVIVNKHCGSGPADASAWKAIRNAIARQLQRNGLSKEQVRRRRELIEDQAYWQEEAQCFQNDSAIRERAWIARHRVPKDMRARKSASKSTKRTRSEQRRHRNQNRPEITSKSKCSPDTTKQEVSRIGYVPRELRRSKRIAQHSRAY